MIAELSVEPYFEETKITNIPDELRAALEHMQVPLLSPPNCPWGEESMRSGINFGNFLWYKSMGNAEMASSAEREDEGLGESTMLHGYTKLGAECKDVHAFREAEMVTITMNVTACSVRLLIGSDLSEWEQTTIQKFAPDVAVYGMRAKKSIERLSARVAAADGEPRRRS